MTLQQKLEEARKKIRGPVEVAARALFSSPNGKVILDALSKVFEDNVLAMTPNGVDPNGTLVNVGASQVVKYLRELAETKETDRP